MERADERVSEDMDENWARRLQAKVEITRQIQPRTEPPTIFRIPEHMRKNNLSAYEPRVISLGPYHQNKPHLKAMETIKLLYLTRFLDRNGSLVLPDYLKAIGLLETQARSYYAEDIDMGRKEFVEMMLLDGCFVIEFLLLQSDVGTGKSTYQEDDDTLWTQHLVKFDMLILENQLPFFIIEKLFELAAVRTNNIPSPAFLALRFFDDLSVSNLRVPSKEVIPKLYHLLHLFHSSLVPNSEKGLAYKIIVSSEVNPTTTDTLLIPCATKLADFGIQFKPTMPSNTWVISYRGAVMNIPPIRLHNESNLLFRNLIALEQCFAEASNRVTAYAMLMNCLIATKNDLALLQNTGIVVRDMSMSNHTEDIALLFKNICRDAAFDYDAAAYLSGISKVVNMRCKNLLYRYHEQFKKLLRNPLEVFNFTHSVLIIATLTIIQTAFTVLQYYH